MDSNPIKWHERECRAIPGFTGYFACEDGSILSGLKSCDGRSKVNTGQPRKALKADLRPIDGRKRYTLRADSGKLIRRYGSHFVLLAFTGEKPAGMEACHENGDCTNDSATNLRWDTSTANKADMLKHGTRIRGQAHNKSKVTDAQADEIIERRKQGEKLKSLAIEFGVTESAISFISKGKRNKCLTA